MLNTMRKERCVRTIGVRLTEAEWKSVEQRRNSAEHESISDVIRRLIAESSEKIAFSADVGRSLDAIHALIEPAPVSPTVRRFVATFQPTLTREQRDARVNRIIVALITNGVQYNGFVAKAVDVTHVAQCCQDVLEHPPRDLRKAWPMVLARLAETYDDTKNARLEAIDAP